MSSFLVGVETRREYYPMTFYPESLEKILHQLNQDPNEVPPSFVLDPLPLVPQQVHYYSEIALRQRCCGVLTLIFLVVTVILVSWFRGISVLFLFFPLVTFLGYLSLENSRQRLRRELNHLNQKITGRLYQVGVSQSQKNQVSATELLLDSLAAREKIYSYEIDTTANKGFSENYFLSYLLQWFPSPWRILEHCKFDHGHTPTADFILIYDDLKLAVDLEIDEPYTLKENKPIHTLEDPWYIKRDRLFLDFGFIVIRFAEYQIAKYPDHCCLHIVRVLNQFLSSTIKIHIPQTTSIKPLESSAWKVKAWTFTEAQIMAENQIRDQYLEPVRAFNLSNQKLPNPE
jgi:hypothetical protein